MLPQIKDIAAHAFFLDLDGTLAHLAARPELVRVDAECLSALNLLNGLGASVAIVSGRPIVEIDELLSPLVLPAAGVHGFECRRPDGRLDTEPVDETRLKELYHRLESEFSQHNGVWVEVKPGAIAIHYRARPDLAEICARAASDIVKIEPTAEVLQGKMVSEIVFHTQNKGTAIARFMQMPPFAGRRPVFAGDDVTDEAGFLATNEMDGLSIKVGAGPTTATHRAKDTTQFLDWFVKLAAGAREGIRHDKP